MNFDKNKSAFVEIMAWDRMGDMSLYKHIYMTPFFYAYTRHQGPDK